MRQTFFAGKGVILLKQQIVISLLASIHLAHGHRGLLLGSCLDGSITAIAICILLSDSGDFIIEFTTLGQVTMLVIVSLVFEIFAIKFCHRLPSAADLLHDFQRTHIGIRIDNLRSGFFDEDHVGRQAFLRFFDCRALVFQRFKLALVPLLV